MNDGNHPCHISETMNSQVSERAFSTRLAHTICTFVPHQIWISSICQISYNMAQAVASGCLSTSYQLLLQGYLRTSVSFQPAYLPSASVGQLSTLHRRSNLCVSPVPFAFSVCTLPVVVWTTPALVYLLAGRAASQFTSEFALTISTNHAEHRLSRPRERDLLHTAV